MPLCWFSYEDAYTYNSVCQYMQCGNMFVTGWHPCIQYTAAFFWSLWAYIYAGCIEKGTCLAGQQFKQQCGWYCSLVGGAAPAWCHSGDNPSNNSVVGTALMWKVQHLLDATVVVNCVSNCVIGTAVMREVQHLPWCRNGGQLCQQQCGWHCSHCDGRSTCLVSLWWSNLPTTEWLILLSCGRSSTAKAEVLQPGDLTCCVHCTEQQ